MTDSQIIMGIMSNDNSAWRHICRNLRPPFIATLRQMFSNEHISQSDMEDIFQDSCIILMDKVKSGKFKAVEGASLFSYFVEIGKFTFFSFKRKRKSGKERFVDDSPHIIQIMPARETDMGADKAEGDMTAAEIQKEQEMFLDRVFESIPADCQMLLKRFYWDHKPLDEIAGILGLKNADTAKTKKNRCMNKFKDIAAKLIGNDEFAEEAVRASAERAALRAILQEEALIDKENIGIAALDNTTGKGSCQKPQE